MERLEISRIHPSSKPLRDKLENIEELASSIIDKGLLQPIIVRPSTKNTFEVVAGNRRLAACKMAKWKRIPSYIVNYDDKESLEISIIENVQHQSLSFIEEAKAFDRYVKERGYGAASELARRIGKSPTYVSRRLALLDLPLQIQNQLLRHRKSAGIAQELVPLIEDLPDDLVKIALDSEATVRRVRRAVKDIKDDEDSGLPTAHVTSEDERQQMIDRVFVKYVSSLKICLMRLDEALDYLNEDEWLIWNTLMSYRAAVHSHIDEVLRLETKCKKKHV